MSEADFPSASETEIQEGKSLAWLSYISILFLIPFIVQKHNPFSRYHARQGMILFFAEAALGVIWVLAVVIENLIRIATYSATGIGGLCKLLLGVVLLIALLLLVVLAVIGIVQASSGRFWKMPLFGSLAEKWARRMIEV